MKKALTTLIGCLMMASCSPSVEDYAEISPKLDLREYLNGRLTAHGMIYDWRGKASRHFVATIDASWQGNTGTLDEHFTYSDGTSENRVWTLQFQDDQHFTGTAGDVIGTGEGKQYGNAVNFDYVLRVKRDDGDTIDITVDDWMFLTADGVLLNRSYLKKFGLPVGEVQIAFTKE